MPQRELVVEGENSDMVARPQGSDTWRRGVTCLARADRRHVSITLSHGLWRIVLRSVAL